ncbi:TetR/AcrR family transcriptional regulator [Nonomuraea longicatena]|uniref:TetR/AcrR family transcriptional regulator n=1 Tax=Nonomuraea longicatena TaxID=83682 RepID=A0ABN1QKR2_9ACTN
MSTTHSGKGSDLERRLALLWIGHTPGQRGPNAQLTVDAIVRAAIRVADANGLETLSMQRVAAELGYSTMSIYNHVPSKDLLLELMADAAAGEPPPSEDTQDWKGAVLRWAGHLWATFQLHPWILRIPLDHAPIGPNQLTWLDRLLRHLLVGGLAGSEAMAAGLHLISAVRGAAQVSADLTGGHRTEEPPGQAARLLAELIDPRRFPVLAAVNAAASSHEENGTDGGHDLPADLTFGIGRFLDGIEVWAGSPKR